jgi:small subunit ribosomal protein S15
MARMHARRRGKSGSHRPVHPEIPTWQGPGKKEVEDLVMKLAREGRSTSEIGMVLRDTHGVPSIKLTTGKQVTQILADGGISPRLPEYLQSLLKKAIRLDEHLKEKRKDLHNKRALTLVESRIRRLAKYYKRTGRLPEDWKYSLDGARLLIE